MAASRSIGFSNIDLGSAVDTIVDPQQQLADMESDITQVPNLIQQMVQPHILFKREINDRSAAILRLPRDIFEEIFNKFLEDDITIASDGLPTLRRSPLLLGRICSTWREVAWSTSRLWRIISLNLTRKTNPLLVDQWFVRSGSLQLFIRVLCRISTPDAAVDATLSVIARHSERWRTIVLEMPFFCLSPLDGIRNRLPNLRRLVISRQMWHRSPGSSVEIFSVAPQLCDVSVRGIIRNPVQFPASQLRRLSLENAYVHECVDMLRRCPLITQCTFDAITEVGPDPGEVIAAHLKVLELGIYSGDEHLSSVFNSITVPAARELICHSSGTAFPHQSFVSFISRSACSLRSLSLWSFDISNNDLVICLRVVPSLCELALEYLHTSNELFEMLNPDHPSNIGSDRLLPALELFTYKNKHSLDFSMATSFLHSRWQTEDSARLRSAIFRTNEDGRLEVVIPAQLKQLVVEGMHIEIKTADEHWP